MIDIVVMIVTIILIFIIGIINYKKSENYIEKTMCIVLFIVVVIPCIIYCLDKFNMPTEFNMTKNLDSQNWLSFLGNYTSSIVGAIIGGAITVLVTVLQIEKNNEQTEKRDKENLRLQNMPILKYTLDTRYEDDGQDDSLIMSNQDTGRIYRLNISLKNIGLNNIKNIKVDFESEIIKKKERFIGKDSIISMEMKEEIIIKKYFSIKYREEPYKMKLIVYYEDVLNNLYRQILDIDYITTNSFKKGANISYIKYIIKEEELINKEEINK